MQCVGSWFSSPGITPAPLELEGEVSTIGPPRKSLIGLSHSGAFPPSVPISGAGMNRGTHCNILRSLLAFSKKIFLLWWKESNVRRSPLSAPFPPPGAVLWGCNAGIYDSGLHTTWFKILYVSQRAEAGVRVWGPDDIVGLLSSSCLPCSASY